MSEQAQDLWLCEPPRDMSPKETAGYYGRAAELLEHLIKVAEPGDEALYVVLVDARVRCRKQIKVIEDADKEARAQKLRAELRELEGTPEHEEGPGPATPVGGADELLAAASKLLGDSAAGTEEADKVEREVRRLVLEARRALGRARRREASEHEGVEPENGGGRASA